MTIQTKPTTYNKVWGRVGQKDAPTDVKLERGWEVEKPPYEVMNWLQNRQDQFIAHANQRGIPQWDAVTEYKANISYVTGAVNGIVYRATVDNTNTNPETDLSGTWLRAFDSSSTSYTKPESDSIRNSERTISDNKYLAKADNLASVASTAESRNNLSVFSKSEVNGLLSTERTTSNNAYLSKSDNLASLTNKAVSRTNLDVYSKSETYQKSEVFTKTEINNGFLSKSGNLAGIADPVVARANLGILSAAETYSLIPPGTLRISAVNNQKPFEIPCDGRTLLIANEPALFAEIGITYGGDGVTTFRVPDYRGEFLRGFDAIGGTARGVDSGRVFPQAQGSAIGSHRHKMFSNAGTNRPDLTTDNFAKHSGLDGSVDSEYTINGVSSPEPTLGNSGATGGSETRPRNMPVYIFIHR